MIPVNGSIVDARTMPPEVLAEARRRGLIPDLPTDRIGASGGESHEGCAGPGAGGSEPKDDDDAPATGLAEAVRDVIDILRGQPASGSEGNNGWDRIVRTVVASDSLPDSQIKVIAKVIAKAYRGWSDAQHRSIWYETDTGMTDYNDGDALCDASFDGIGYALPVEMLDEVTHAARRDADELNKAGAKRPPRKKVRAE